MMGLGASSGLWILAYHMDQFLNSRPAGFVEGAGNVGLLDRAMVLPVVLVLGNGRRAVGHLDQPVPRVVGVRVVRREVGELRHCRHVPGRVVHDMGR